MIAWERWAGEQVGKKYSIDKLLSAQGSSASFLASSRASPSEQIVVTFFPTEHENDGWPGHVLHLRHSHLRLILGAGHETIRGGEWRCIALEPADSLLSDRLARDGPLPTPLARQVAEQMIEALHYLHGRNLVYRNLKPDTIASIGEVWKLADYTMLHPAGYANPKHTRALLTSSPQAPPDAYTGLISPGWDIYSLGVTLNQCLRGDDTQRGGRLRLPDPFESIVSGCLEPEPGDRITLDEIARMLGLNSLNGQPLKSGGREWLSPSIRRQIPIVKPIPRVEKPKRAREWRWLGVICFILFCEALALLFLASTRSKPVSPPTPVLQAAAIPEPKPVAAPEPELDPTAAKEEIGRFLKHWLSTVQNRDLEGHLECYAPVVEPFFRAASADRTAVRSEKQRVFARIGKISKIAIDSLTFESLAADQAVVSFRKEWDIGGSHPSSGVEDERLTLRRIDGQWKIAGEEENNIRWVKRS